MMVFDTDVLIDFLAGKNLAAARVGRASGRNFCSYPVLTLQSVRRENALSR